MQRRSLTHRLPWDRTGTGIRAGLGAYQLTNLVSNQVGTAKHTDPLIVNAWDWSMLWAVLLGCG